MNRYAINNTNTNRKHNIIAIIARILFVIIIVFGVWSQNNLVMTSKFVYADSDLPKSLVGYKILHISDICNTSNEILQSAKIANPDVIVLSGGYQDKDGKTDRTVKLVNALCKIAPVYYIYNTYDTTDCLSNTEAVNITDKSVILTSDIKDAKELIEKAYGNGIIDKASKGDEEAVQYIQYVNDVLSNEQYSNIKLCGINNMVDKSYNDIHNLSYSITGSDLDDFTIMVNGNMDNLEALCKTNLDIMLIGGTFGKVTETVSYAKGAYSCLSTQLFVSGGCGNYMESRIANLPEIQLITLSDGTIEQNNPMENIMDLFIDDVGTIYDNDGGFSEYTYRYGNFYGVEYE